MIKSFLRLVLLAVVALVVYNFFFGTVEEKGNAKEVVKEFKEVGAAVKDLLKSEKVKFEGGKYDEVLGNIGNVFQKLKNGAKDLDENYLDRISRLDNKRKELENRLEASEASQGGSIAKVNNTSDQKKIKLELGRLLGETERLMQDIDTAEEE